MSKSTLNSKSWRRTVADQDYLISTRPSLISRDFVQTAFASEETYWAKPLPDGQVEILLENSVTLGLYKVLPSVPRAKSADTPESPRSPSPTLADEDAEQLQQIGMARIITDHMTTAYLTDVYTSPDYRAQGLGKWLVQCCGDIFDGHPALRRSFLISGSAAGQKFYARELGMWDSAEERDKLAFMTRRTFKVD
jgi:GNAT superfamily N-acetyltransferase